MNLLPKAFSLIELLVVMRFLGLAMIAFGLGAGTIAVVVWRNTNLDPFAYSIGGRAIFAVVLAVVMIASGALLRTASKPQGD